MPNFENEFMKTIIANDSGLPSAIELQADGSSVLRTIDPTGETLGMADVFGGGVKPDIYALSEAAGAPVTEAEVAGTMGGVVPGAAIGAATAIPDIAALVKGGVQAATAEEGSRIEEFLKGFSSISGVIGSEKAFELYDAGVDMLPISDEAKQGLKQGALVGEVIGFGTGAKKGAEAVGGYVEGAPARIAERGEGVTLGMGADPMAPIDEAIVGVQKPMGKEPALSDIEQNVRSKFPDVDLDFYGDKDKGYTLSKIVVPKDSRKQGVGQAVMSELTQAADNEGAVIKLTPSKDFGATSTARLRKFYKQFGFVENKGRYKDFSIKETMYRLPVEKEINASIKPPTDDKPGIIAFHGSGADFDEFKLEKVGTGVGHQGYGSGLYFSSSEELAKGYKGDAGKLFMVRLGVKESNLLDWQQPLKQQPEMLKKIRTLIDDKDILKSFDYNVEKGITSGNAYSNYIGKTKEETSKLLKSVGIDGIKYLDIGSKGGGKTIADAPTNYVIFNDKAIKILEKYGIVGPVAITALGAAKQEGADDGNI